MERSLPLLVALRKDDASAAPIDQSFV